MKQGMPFAVSTRGLSDSFAPDGQFTRARPGRVFNSNFIPSATRPSYVKYPVNIDCDSTITLTGGTTDHGSIQIVDITAGGQVLDRIQNYSQFSGTVLIGVAITNRQQVGAGLSAFIHPNTTIQVQTSVLAGTPAFTFQLSPTSVEWYL